MASESDYEILFCKLSKKICFCKTNSKYNRDHSAFWDKKIVTLLVILLNILAVEGAPARRRAAAATPFCSDLEVKSNCPRWKYNPLMELHPNGESLCRCPQVACIDEDPLRVPSRIFKVFCTECGAPCSRRGDYRCRQMYQRMDVFYADRKDDVEVEFGCVCGAQQAGPPLVGPHPHLAPR